MKRIKIDTVYLKQVDSILQISPDFNLPVHFLTTIYYDSVTI